MSLGSSTKSYPAFARIGLRENPRKNLNQRANRDTSIHVCDLMTSYDINIHSQHYPPSSHPAETFSWLEHSSWCRMGGVRILGFQNIQSYYYQRSQKSAAGRLATPCVVSGARVSVSPAQSTSSSHMVFCVLRSSVLFSNQEINRERCLRWAGHVARMGESRNAYRVLVGRPEGKRPLGRPRRTWEDNIKMDLREVGYDDRDWINLVQDRDRWRAYVRAAMNLKWMSETDQEEERELVGSLAEKKLPAEGCRMEGMVSGRRVRGRRRYQMIDDIKIYGSYEEP
ncbi:hypothetical protein ANN_11792 [Periplaneta americana]|uniref:Uncharacterized protein n=1 Tax=Periplaneta americana TaxID=6978 RepID=A0ABQ8T613_PERAM|nr:hypothetical protein ANN_11792 [Periplaneta americana]